MTLATKFLSLSPGFDVLLRELQSAENAINA